MKTIDCPAATFSSLFSKKKKLLCFYLRTDNLLESLKVPDGHQSKPKRGPAALLFDSLKMPFFCVLSRFSSARFVSI